MQFALVNNTRTLPLQSGQRASCPACGSEVLAKCGVQRMHHWAHRGELACNFSREKEKRWHRVWKERFPSDWRERVQIDAAGQRHIADVYTEHGLTIELQHSAIPPDERAAREKFHRNMVWVVDGTRLVRDFGRFQEGMKAARRPLKGVGWVYLHRFPGEVFAGGWLAATAPVLFDFMGDKDKGIGPINVRMPLWCLLPQRLHGNAVIARVSREAFVQRAHEMGEPIPFAAVLGSVEAVLNEERRLEALRSARQQAAHLDWRPTPRRRYARF